ncbi:phenoloxidase 1-like [Aethina tumida]|uniref:phenoloxidase 1-like n=1 Tax=Aethina tumida TaxID=116153 RepID=UPI0021483C0B|nr:phenoloxidase 1-like [Aethina tumida]
MDEDKKHLLLLFDRPKEPVFMAKGRKNTVFKVDKDYLADEYKPIAPQVVNRFGGDAGEKVNVPRISIPPLDDILDLGREENFSLFIPKHRAIAGKLINIYLGMRNVQDLLSIAVYTRDRVNPYLFNYALSVALLHRPDTKDIDLPSFILSFPDKYIDSKIFARAREEATIVPEGSKIPIEIPVDYTASNLEEEHRVAYWREDIGINLHHWHWHLVYPFEAARQIVDKNRRGELFYYMHQQIVARYNFERFSNNLKRVDRLIDWKQPIREAYFPKLDSLVASRAWPARVANQTLSNLRRPVDQISVDIDDLMRWRDRIFDAIHSGVIRNDQGQEIQLTENEGIDILGNMVESSVISPNRALYGDLHNMGHTCISYIHDPDHRHLESFGVMGDSATAMRDPVFYRWHAYLDDLFQQFKNTLPTYTTDQLDFPGITCDSIEIQTPGGNSNQINTFWQQSDVDLSRGLDFQPRGAVFARFTHLQHRNFQYKIVVNNQSNGNKQGTCRIFLAPKFDERGNPWSFREQKLMFIELDKFTVNLKQGMNTITRASTQSSVTIPFERTFRDLDTNRPQTGDQLAQFNFCGCGWPQHMLVPKGTPEGLQSQLFVMISDYSGDRVNQDTSGACNDAGSYCGIKDKLYPDRRSMGYPFDRLPRPGVDTLQQFLTPNMRVQDISIKFENRTFKPRSNQ